MSHLEQATRSCDTDGCDVRIPVGASNRHCFACGDKDKPKETKEEFEAKYERITVPMPATVAEIERLLNAPSNGNPHAHTSSNLDALRFDDGKRRWDLFPFDAAEEIVEVFEFGAEKYGDDNWRKGMNWSRCFSSMCRHLFAWFGGEDTDGESGLSHLAHIGCNVLFLISYKLNSSGADNRPKRSKV